MMKSVGQLMRGTRMRAGVIGQKNRLGSAAGSFGWSGHVSGQL